MKFIINKKEMFESIKVCNSIIDNNITSPYIQGMYIKAEKNKIIIITTNGFISSKSELINNIKVIEEGSFLIKSKLFFSIMQKLKNEEILFEKVDNSVLKIRTESFDSNINIMDDEQYPNINFNYLEWQEIIIQPIIFKSILNKIIHSVSQNKEKVSVLNGVCIQSKENKLHIVGTDSFKLSYLSYDFEGPEFKIVIDSNVFLLLSEIISFNENINLYISDNNIMIKIGNFIFSTKIIDGEYPEIKDIIRSPRDNSLLVSKKDLIEALERGIILAMVEKKPIVKIDFKKDLLMLNFKSIELGSSEEKIKVSEFKGNEMSFLLNATFLITLLKAIDSEEVSISSSKDNKPIIITNKSEENFIQLLLPIRNAH